MIDLPLLSILLNLFLFPICLILNIVVLYNWRSFIPFIVVYAGWMIASHNKKLVPPTRPALVNKLWLFRKTVDYFPAKVILPPDRGQFSSDQSYIFLSYPHGVLGTGTLVNFCFSNPFPNKPIFPLTLEVLFYVPFWRDLLLFLGLSSVKKTSIRELIHLKKSMVILLGGAREVLLAKPFNPTIILTPRRGIFRIALKHRIPVVPVFTFGEMEAWETRPFPSWLHFFQKITKRFTGVMPVLFWPPVPRRVPLVTVIGEPIYADHTEDTEGNVLIFQEKFRNSLLALYNLHYQKFNYSQLTIL